MLNSHFLPNQQTPNQNTNFSSPWAVRITGLSQSYKVVNDCNARGLEPSALCWKIMIKHKTCINVELKIYYLTLTKLNVN